MNVALDGAPGEILFLGKYYLLRLFCKLSILMNKLLKYSPVRRG
jgi:hypothetical protein